MNPANEQGQFPPLLVAIFFSSFMYSRASRYLNDCGGTKLLITSEGSRCFASLTTFPSSTATPCVLPAKYDRSSSFVNPPPLSVQVFQSEVGEATTISSTSTTPTIFW